MCACALTGPKNPARFECSLNSERNSESPVGPKKKEREPRKSRDVRDTSDYHPELTVTADIPERQPRAPQAVMPPSAQSRGCCSRP
jgi:hypothetical protein